MFKLQLKTLARDLGSEEVTVKIALDQLSTSVDDIIENVRRLSRDLSPSILEDLGLVAALRNLFAGLKSIISLPVFQQNLMIWIRYSLPEHASTSTECSRSPLPISPSMPDPPR